MKKEAQRAMLIDQLTRTITVGDSYRTYRARTGSSFAKNSASLELQKMFLEDIQDCNIDDFEDIASKWMRKMKRL